MISASLSPNTEWDDVWLAFKIIFCPWKWREGNFLRLVEQWFKHYFPDYEVAFFNSGRSALLAILKAFAIGKGDEILIQAFTCAAVPNSVIWAGAKPVYVDIDKSLNMDPDKVSKHLTSKTKAIIVQHTFGIPAQIMRLVSLAHKYNLILIEDCAHSLGASYSGKKIGLFGDAAFFSFGRDKVVSSVFGGAAIINVKCQMSNVKLKQYEKELSFPSYFWIFQQLLHPIAFSVILPLYDVVIGKILLVLLQKFRLLSFPVYPAEKQGLQPAEFPARFPNALAVLLAHQLAKLERFNGVRGKIAVYYRSSLSNKSRIATAPNITGSIYLRFPVLVNNPDILLKKARSKNILLGNWYHNVIDPTGVNFEKIGYIPGSCPKAEAAARRIINLPTRITLDQAKRVVNVLL